MCIRDSVKADKIYFEGTAVASDGHRYTVNEKSDKTLMKRENQYTKTYNITCLLYTSAPG